MLGIDINLVGKTDMERVKMLLKNSLVHIDGEGGFTHLRRALNGGKSIVFFGATSREFFGYKGNENLKGNGCDHPCEWLTKDWLNHCPRGYIEPPCMTSITPAMAMNAFRGIVKYHLPIEIRGGRQCGIERI
jgi:ADP-heptose:LPS heptosyltransferase